MTTIKISQWKDPIRSGKGTVLDRALRQGVPYPHQCRSGECGRCKSRLIKGSVRHFPCLDIALSEQEKTDNLVLACRCEATTDIEVTWLATDLLPEQVNTRYTVEVVGLHRVGRVTRLIVKQSPAELPLRFIAGQYVYFHLPGCPARPYSPASVSGLETIEFHIEHQVGGWVSDVIATALRTGDQFTISGPEGDACLQPDESGPLLAVGSGTGMAPMLSIVKASLATSPLRPIALVYTEQVAAHQYLNGDLQCLADRYKHLLIKQIITRRESDRLGNLNEQLTDYLLQLPFSLTNTSVFIAGSPKKVQLVANTIKLLGANPDLVRADAFAKTPAVPEKLSLITRLKKMLKQPGYRP